MRVRRLVGRELVKIDFNVFEFYKYAVVCALCDL